MGFFLFLFFAMVAFYILVISIRWGLTDIVTELFNIKKLLESLLEFKAQKEVKNEK